MGADWPSTSGGNFWPQQVEVNIVLLLSIFLVATQPQLCDGLRMINLDLPETAHQGDTIRLSCFFSLKQVEEGKGAEIAAAKELAYRKQTWKRNSNIPSGQIGDKQEAEYGGEQLEQLYAIKWYKDEREFFRFRAQEYPRKQSLPMDGVSVDLDKSDNRSVVLKNISLKTSGSFRCEVSTDAPDFVTKSVERRMRVYSLPSEGPLIEPMVHKGVNIEANSKRSGSNFYLAERVELACRAQESKPAAKLDWIINDILNLSQSGVGSSLFEVKRQHFVRLPSNVLDRTTRGKQTFPSLVTFELQNGSIAVSKQQKELGDETKVVNLADSLDQVAEVTSSRLNFTIDANLLQLLEAQAQRPQTLDTYRVSRQSPERKLIADGGSRGLAWTSPSSKQMSPFSGFGASNGEPSTSQQRWKSSFGPSSRTQGKGNSMMAKANFDSIRRKASKITAESNNQRLLLKVRCVARVLDLSMIDEIKFIITNRTRGSEFESDRTTDTPSQRRLSEASKSGAWTLKAELKYHNAFALSLIILMFTAILQ